MVSIIFIIRLQMAKSLRKVKGYTSKQNCQHGIDCLRQHAGMAEVIDRT